MSIHLICELLLSGIIDGRGNPPEYAAGCIRNRKDFNDTFNTIRRLVFVNFLFVYSSDVHSMYDCRTPVYPRRAILV